MLFSSLYRDVLQDMQRAVSTLLYQIGKTQSAESWLQEHDLETVMIDAEDAEQKWRAYCNWLAQHLHPEFVPAITAAARASAKVDYVRYKSRIQDESEILALLAGEGSRPSRELQDLRQAFAAAKDLAKQSMDIRQRIACNRNPHDTQWTDNCWTGFAETFRKILSSPMALTPWMLPADPIGPAYLFESRAQDMFLYTEWPFNTIYHGPAADMRALSNSQIVNRSGYFTPEPILHLAALDLTWSFDASFGPNTSSTFRRKIHETNSFTRVDLSGFNIARSERPVVSITSK